jgi:hypothetical protein
MVRRKNLWPGENCSNEWPEAGSEDDYTKALNKQLYMKKMRRIDLMIYAPFD